MHEETTNYLYRNPELYDQVFSTAPTAVTLTAMVTGLLERHGAVPPSSVLDIGCGTSFKLARLAALGYACTGVDYLPGMVDYSRKKYPDIDFAVGDIRSLRYGRTFDIVTCLGWVIENVHSDHDIAQAMETLAVHSTPGSLLILDAHNPIGDLMAAGSRKEFSFDVGGQTAYARAEFEVDRRNQVLTRTRQWTLPDGTQEIDTAHFRLYFPKELENHLNRHGFEVVDMFDNTDLHPSALSGAMLYVAARYTG
jgi:SAM-dependent methyltransferase